MSSEDMEMSKVKVEPMHDEVEAEEYMTHHVKQEPTHAADWTNNAQQLPLNSDVCAKKSVQIQYLFDTCDYIFPKTNLSFYFSYLLIWVKSTGLLGRIHLKVTSLST